MPAKRLFGIISIIFLFVTCISCKSSNRLIGGEAYTRDSILRKHFRLWEDEGNHVEWIAEEGDTCECLFFLFGLWAIFGEATATEIIQETEWVIDMDIEACFDTVNHDKLIFNT